MDAPATRILTPVGILAETYNVERVRRIPGWLRRRTTRAVRVTVTTQSVGSRRITLRSDGHGCF